MKRSASGSAHVGFGKLILFGEHFAVYKHPAIVASVAACTDCTVEFSDAEWSSGLIVEDNRPAVPGYKDEKAEEMLAGTQLVLAHMGVDAKKKGVKVTLAGDLCAVSGIGASAAHCVSLARALAHRLGRQMSEDEINAAGFEGEKGYHGTPSGIDNTASTFGGVLRFKRTDAGPPVFEACKIGSCCRLVYASTGIVASTTTVVGAVRDKRAAQPEWFAGLEARYTALFEKAERALADADLATLGALANENHAILQELGVSCKELDTLVDAARAAGALGAKMTGTGRGGLMWALVDEATQDRVYDALQKIAPQVWKTSFA